MALLEEKTDQELIRRYVTMNDKRAVEVLVRRHYNVVLRRFIRSTKNESEAQDLCQKLWLKIVKNLDNYAEQGKFANYLNMATSNMLKDYWKSNYSGRAEELDANVADRSKSAIDIELDSRSGIAVLITKLIPELPTHLRLPFLLKHESEYWEEKKQMRWHHLAELNGINALTAARLFCEARDKLLLNTNTQKSYEELSDEELLLFVVWTQAQREDKKKKMTEAYLAKLIGIPVNTFKTRYRKAISELKKGLEEWR